MTVARATEAKEGYLNDIGSAGDILAIDATELKGQGRNVKVRLKAVKQP